MTKWSCVVAAVAWVAIVSGAALVSCKAQADVIGIDIASIHAHPGMNGVNPGIYYHFDSGLSVGTYYNSERRTTVWGGYTWHDSEDVFALTVGAATGYSSASVVPIVVPSVRFGIAEDTSIRLSLLAAKNPAIHLSFERRF